MKYKSIKNSMGHTCRTCLNDKYGINLKSADCRYTVYPSVCYRCGEVKNIVEHIRLRKRLLLRLKLF